MKREELKDLLQNSYSKEKWIKTLQFLSGSKNLLTISLEPKFVEIKSAKAKEIVVEVVQLGTLKTTDGITLPIFDVTLQNGIKIEYNRVGVNELLKTHILKDAVKGAIVTFHYPSAPSPSEKAGMRTEWRFSFISKFGSDYFAEAESVETNPKKYTYIFGTSEEHRTALERLYNLEQSRFRLEDFFDAFNVEPVSKEFFNNYIKFYKDFVNYLSGEELIKGKWVSINEPSKYFDEVFANNSIEVRNFVKRLLGRIVFLYFIQKKRWLGANSNKYDNGNPNFLQNLFIYDNTTRDNFYSNWLSKLFFDALNNKKRKNDEFLMPNKEVLLVPFLNGGLFDEVQEPKNHRSIEFPPILFELLFNFFNGYNFTIYENSPEDHTIAVDPEMLGNIFENLLEDNKDKGAFYTPKEIVHYMAQESLIEYLNTKLNPLSTSIAINESYKKQKTNLLVYPNRDYEENYEDIQDFIKNKTTNDFIISRATDVNKYLDDVKICDPAIGSGAFPMGLLQEIFSLKALLHFSLNKNPEDWRPADVKQAIIENSIYGVDIEPGAVDIARLRFWLSLVVDEPKPKPLPNLDFKIIVGNSLLSRYKLDSPIEDVFKNLNENRKSNKLEPITLQSYKDCINDYMYLSDAESKKEYKILIKEIKDAFVTTYSNDKINGLAKARGKYENLLRVDIFGKPLGTKTEIVKAKKELEFEEKKRKEAEDGLHYKDAIEWRFEFPNILDTDGNYQGFDIVIGNPPYIQIKWLNDKSSIENSNFETFSKTGDVYCVFYELANNILKEKGNASYITSNKWLRAEYGKNLREYFIKKTNPLKLIDFKGYKVFETATVDTNIILWKKEKYNGKTATLSIENDFNKTMSLSNYFKENSKSISFDFNDQWIVLNVNELKIRELVENNNVRLSKLHFELNYGILTGANPVFIIPKIVFEDLIRKDEKNLNIIKPILRGKDLTRYGYEFDQFYLINSHTGIREKNILPIDIPNNYPTIENYFNESGLEFKNRGEQGLNWFNLRSCTYIDYFEYPKIIYADIVQDRGKFYYDEEKFYTNDTAFIISGKDIKPLTAILNSTIVSYIYKTFYSGGGLGDKGIRFKKEFLGKVPIPNNFNDAFICFFVDVIQYLKKGKTSQINDIVKNEDISSLLEEVIDGCVFELYFESIMKEKNIAIIDDVKQLLEKFNLLDNFQSLDEVIKNQKIWELFKTLSNPDNKVRNKILRFPIESPDVLKIILRG